MGSIKIKKEGTEYIEGLITERQQDSRLYVYTGLEPQPYLIKDGYGYANNSLGPYNHVTNIWSIGLPQIPPGGEFILQIPAVTDFTTPPTNFPKIDTANNRRSHWAVCTLIRAQDAEVLIKVTSDADEMDPGYVEWDNIYWPAGAKNVRVGMFFWNGEKWKWFGRGV